jgi:ankyrin repeat protein
LLDSYALYYWPFHYGKSGEHRAKIFDSYVKHFMFDGATINDRYTQWAQRFLCHDHRGTQLWSRSGEIAFVVDTTGHPPGDVMDPVHLACCNGWLEVLEHYQQNEDQDNFSNAARKMYKAATEYGQIGVVEWLLRSDIRPTNKEIRKMFQHKKEEIIRALFDHNILTVNDPIDGEPPLIMAIQTPCQSIVEYLLEKGADVNCQDPQRRTPLYHAVMVDAVQLVGFLLDIGANPEIANKDGVTPLKLSIQRQGQIASRMMLETGWYDGMMPSDGEDLLRFALECGSYYTACVLLIHNVDPLLHEEGIREQWMTLLSSLDVIRRASSKRQNDPLRVTVLLFGAILPEDVVSQTLLSIAAQLHHKKAFEVLLDMGVDPACPDIRKISKDPKVAAFIGSDVSGHIQYQQHGLDNSSNDWRELIDELRQGPIAWAALNGNVSLVKLILDQGLDPNITNRKGETVLFFATQQFGNFHSQRMVARDKESIVRSLLEQGAFVNTPKLGSEVLIRNSLLGGYENLVTLLMNSGAEMPSRRANGELDPVLEAFHLGQKGILENLQGRMARHKAQDSGGATQTHLGNGQADDSLALITRLIFRGTMNLLADEKATGMLHGK